MLNFTDLHSFQILGIIFSLFMLITVFFLVKHKRIREKYSLVWFFIGLLILAFSVFRDLMEWVSRLIGIDYAPSAFFAILIASAYLLLLNMSISLSTLKRQNKSLIQEIGLLNLRIDELENNKDRGTDK